MANPAACADPNGEYFEFRYNGPSSIDLSGLVFEDNNSSFTVAGPLLVDPGDLVTFFNDAPAQCYGLTADIGYTTSIGLANGGDLLRLRAPNGTILAELDFTTSAFPITAGVAWELDEANGVWCPADDAIPGATDLGSPGADNGACATGPDTGVDTSIDSDVDTDSQGDITSISFGDLKITEFMADPAACNDNTAEYVEFLYTGSGTVNLDGLQLTDNAGSYTFTAGGTVSAGQTAVAYRTAPSQCYGLSGLFGYTSIGLNNGGDVISLVANGLTVDQVDYNSFTITAGVAWEWDGSQWCEASNAIPGSTDLGSPGIANLACGSTTGDSDSDTDAFNSETGFETGSNLDTDIFGETGFDTF